MEGGAKPIGPPVGNGAIRVSIRIERINDIGDGLAVAAQNGMENQRDKYENGDKATHVIVVNIQSIA